MQNLLKSFAGESQARNRYTYFASVAKDEGYRQIEAIFQETADQEKEHAKRFFKFLEGGDLEITAAFPAGVIGTTAENLKAAADGEHCEAEELYPEFAKVAEEEGFKEIATLMRNIVKSEKEHERIYQLFLDRLEKENLLKEEEEVEWKCRVCGFVFKGKVPPTKCPICKHPQGYFERISDAPVI